MNIFIFSTYKILGVFFGIYTEGRGMVCAHLVLVALVRRFLRKMVPISTLLSYICLASEWHLWVVQSTALSQGGLHQNCLTSEGHPWVVWTIVLSQVVCMVSSQTQGLSTFLVFATIVSLSLLSTALLGSPCSRYLPFLKLIFSFVDILPDWIGLLHTPGGGGSLSQGAACLSISLCIVRKLLSVNEVHP